MKLYFSIFKMHLKSALEYKKSFIIGFLSQFLVFFTYYFIIIALFNKFDNIKGFTMYEVLLCFSIIQFGFAFNEVFARGIDQFDKLIITGNFDSILLKPQSILIQSIISELDLVKASRLIQAIIILIISLINLKIEITLFKIIVLLLMLLSAIIIFFSIFLSMASYCFFTVQGLEIRNTFTDGGKHMAQYPIGIFNKGFVIFFTFVIPYAFVNYYPLLYVLGKSNNVLLGLSPLLVIIYILPSKLLFKFGIKRYTSVGS